MENNLTPTASPTSELQFELSAPSVVEGSRPTEMTVLGLITNRSAEAAEGLLVQVSLMDPQGKLLGQQAVAPALTQLDVADVSPFAATFPVSLQPGLQASVELTEYHATNSANSPLQSETVQVERLPDGNWAVLGRLTNPGGSILQLRNLVVLAVDAQGRPTGLLPWIAGPGRILPHSSQPFVAFGPAGQATKAHIPYARGEIETGARHANLRFASGPDLRQTSQGELFITGALENLGSVPIWGQAALLASMDDQLIGIAQVRYPVPISPDEIRPFSVPLGPYFGELPDPIDPAELTLSAEPEFNPASSTEAAIAWLDLQVESFEFTGSRAFVQGRVVNPGPSAVVSPTVFAAVRSTEGKILGAAWKVVAPRLSTSASESFTLSIDLPAHTTPSMAEYDLRALGTEVER